MLRSTFNDGWFFHEENNWWEKSEKQPVTLPHDYGILRPRDPNAPGKNNVGYFQGGAVCYEKTFAVPAEWKNKTVILEFEGVYMDALVKCNGNVVAKQPYGYTTFHCLLDHFLVPGKENLIEVKAVNNTDNSRWYAGTGMYRPVWIMVSEKEHIAPWGVFVKTVEASTSTSKMEVEISVEAGKTDMPLSLLCLVKNREGQEVTRFPVETGTGRAAFNLANPVLWDVDNPYLYTMETRLLTDGKLLDTAVTSFGIRTVSVSPQTGLLINGKETKLRGGCVHHDNGILGAASYPRAEERKVELMKASGFNAVRCAHNPPAPSFLDACDRLGMLVIDEIFDCWVEGKRPNHYHLHFEEWWERDFAAMLKRDRNHPSVIAWSTGNEVIERNGKSDGYVWSKRLADFARSYDDTRLVTNGMNNISGGSEGLSANVAEKGEIDFFGEKTETFIAPLDVAGYNYFHTRYDADKHRFPDRVICGTESFPMMAFDNWEIIDRSLHVIGDFVWTAIDYFGEAGLGHIWYDGRQDFLGAYPWHMANCGDIDACGFKRPQSFYRDILWGVRDEPYIAVYDPSKDKNKANVSRWGWQDVIPQWDFPGYENEMMTVEVYSRSALVSLFLNGTPVAEKQNGAENKYITRFELPYQAGKLKAVGYSAQRKFQGKCSLITPGPAAAIRLTPDRSKLAGSDIADLCYITVEAVDGSNNLVTNGCRNVLIEVEGSGALLAFGSSDPLSEEMYTSPRRNLYQGRGMAAVRHTGGKGYIKVSAFSDGLLSAAVIINEEFFL